MKPSLSKKPYRGSRDFYPQEMQLRDWYFGKMSHTLETFGFEKIDSPTIEPLDIYLLKTSEEIVNHQIYSFEDRGGRKVAIRPEMTPSVSRMVASRIRELPKPIRWYSIPNLWRYERPSKGRLREHWQLNADIFSAPDEFMADIEILQMSIEIMLSFGAKPGSFQLGLNHRRILNAIFEKILRLDPSSYQSVSRILDKKGKISDDQLSKLFIENGLNTQQIDSIKEYMNTGDLFLKKHKTELKDSGLEYLLDLQSVLNSLGYSKSIKYDPSIVRGFDYYTQMVFEVFDAHPSNKRSIFGGGRYNDLVSYFSDDPCNAVGFGMGDVTFQNFLQTHGLLKKFSRKTQIYVAFFPGKLSREYALAITQYLRKNGFLVELNLGHAKIKKQFQEADSKNIPVVVLQGEEEKQNHLLTVKNMQTGKQEHIAYKDLIIYLNNLFS